MLTVEQRTRRRSPDPEKPPPTEAAVKYAFRAMIAMKVIRLVTITVTRLSTVAIVWLLCRAVATTTEALAGRTTSVDLNARADVDAKAHVEVENEALNKIVSVLSQETTVWILLILCAAVGLGYALRTRRHLKDCIQQLAPFRKRYELKHDPKRSTADLTDRGDSPKQE